MLMLEKKVPLLQRVINLFGWKHFCKDLIVFNSKRTSSIREKHKYSQIPLYKLLFAQLLFFIDTKHGEDRFSHLIYVIIIIIFSVFFTQFLLEENTQILHSVL